MYSAISLRQPFPLLAPLRLPVRVSGFFENPSVLAVKLAAV